MTENNRITEKGRSPGQLWLLAFLWLLYFAALLLFSSVIKSPKLVYNIAIIVPLGAMFAAFGMILEGFHWRKPYSRTIVLTPFKRQVLLMLIAIGVASSVLGAISLFSFYEKALDDIQKLKRDYAIEEPSPHPTADEKLSASFLGNSPNLFKTKPQPA